MSARRKTGNPCNRVRAGARGPAPDLLRRQCELDKANKDLTVQLANALERIGWMEQRWRDRDLGEQARIRSELDRLLAKRQMSEAITFGIGCIGLDEPVKRSFWRRVFSTESGSKRLTAARAAVLIALCAAWLALGFSIGRTVAAAVVHSSG